MTDQDKTKSEHKGKVGIALSGGGIRSATFNLGLLQRLGGKKILDKIDYLSTVSGGGYIGSWWTRYRNRKPNAEFPGSQDDGLEPEEIRHLRQFSNFLSPRLGLFSIEFGRMLVSVLGAILPALIVVNATLAIVLLVFKVCIFNLLEALPIHPSLPDFLEKHTAVWSGLGIIAISACGAIIHILVARFKSKTNIPKPLAILTQLQHLLLMAGAIIFVLSGIWSLAEHFGTELWVSLSALVPAVGVSSLLGYIMKKISLQASSHEKTKSLLTKSLLTPQILSYLAVGLGLFVLASLMTQAFSNELITPLYLFGLLAVIVFLGLFLFDPRYFGMHYFYRRRLVRAYLGEPSLDTEELDADDIFLDQVNDELKPTHIVCCAANDILGDGLTTLNRGSSHATLSSEGVYVGCGKDGQQLDWESYPQKISLGTAVTASAAAFNSVMGFKSKQLGPAVTLVMTALNLRLGLWVQNPNHPRTNTLIKESILHKIGRLLPGWQFFAELFSQVKCIYKEHQGGPEINRYLHLSDGAHFDNLGLYELVRRECRYIIVSDCGADPDYRFEDLGNAIRKIRTDFAVDIQLDVSPLIPDSNGKSRQHTAVGSIRYGSGDMGVVIYIKPALTGDEPEDIQQYVGTHSAFPHESTGDQFYNEAQWESYRRLGFHAGHHIFQYASQDILKDSAARLFNEALWHWSRIPESTLQSLNDLDNRWSALRQGWLQQIPVHLGNELFPEIDHTKGTQKDDTQGAAVGPAIQDDQKALDCIISGMKFFEDLWRAADLDTNKANPDLRGWMNVIQRWSRSETTRQWWYVIRCLFSSRFVQFMESATPIDLLKSKLELQIVALKDNDNADKWKTGLAGEAFPEFIRDFDYTLKNENTTHVAIYQQTFNKDGKNNNLQFGVLLFNENRTPSNGIEKQEVTCSWKSEHFLIAPGLWGTGLGSRFIKEFIKKYQSEDTQFQVRYHTDQKSAEDGVPRMSVKSLQSLYRPHGFKPGGPDPESKRSIFRAFHGTHANTNADDK